MYQCIYIIIIISYIPLRHVSLNLAHICGAEGYCNYFVCLSILPKFLDKNKHWHFNQATNRLQIIQRSE